MRKTKNAEYTPAYAKRIARVWAKDSSSTASFAWYRGQQTISRMRHASSLNAVKL